MRRKFSIQSVDRVCANIFHHNLVIIMQNLLMLSHGSLWEPASFVPPFQTGQCYAELLIWLTGAPLPHSLVTLDLSQVSFKIFLWKFWSVLSFKRSSVLIFTAFLQVTPFIMTSKLCFLYHTVVVILITYK